MLLLQRYLIFLLISAITLPLLTSGLKCKCTGDCPEESTCETTAEGVCYAQYYSDVSGKHWNLRKGCLDGGLSSVICQYTKSDTHTNVCCNDTDFCNDNLITLPPVVSCYCRGKGCQDGLCILDPSTNQSCHTTFSRVGSEVSRQRGCTTECTEHHQDKEIRKCCREDKCNNEDIPSVWPSPTISPSPSSSAVVTAATPTPPTNDCDCASPTADILTTEQPTDQRRPTHLICHCSGCRDGGKTCLAAVACASRVIETVRMAWCIQEDLICKNNSFQLSCCYEDYCNDPFRPISGPPCDDEDTESSGGCDFGPITPSTASPTTTTSTSTVSSEATPTSTTKATPTESITEDKDTETQYDNSEMMMIFYFFTIILSLIVITMIIVVVVCVVMLCHYRGMAYKTVLSSSTILESAMKEKGSPITNSSPV